MTDVYMNASAQPARLDKRGSRAQGADFDPNCRACPRLADFLAQSRERYPDYHCRPVAAFGSERPTLLVVGLAPGLHGANASGRPFTGDHAGILLYQTLYDIGRASRATSESVADGLELIDCRITNAVKCVPPANKPTPAEIRTCNGWLKAELSALGLDEGVLDHGGLDERVLEKEGLKQTGLDATGLDATGLDRGSLDECAIDKARLDNLSPESPAEHKTGAPRANGNPEEIQVAPLAVVALGRIAHEAVLRALGLKLADYRFAHGAEHALGEGLRPARLFDSYHCSRYNTQTRRLTPEMFLEVFRRADAFARSGDDFASGDAN